MGNSRSVGRGIVSFLLQGTDETSPWNALCPPVTREQPDAPQGGGTHALPRLQRQSKVSGCLQTQAPPGWGLAGGGLLRSNGGRSVSRAAAVRLEPVPAS